MALVLTSVQVKEARAWVRSLCAEHHVGRARCDDAQLAISELIGNALRHGQPPVEVDVRWVDDGLLLSVSDTEPQPPRPRSAPLSTAEAGRGLHLVQAVARSWGSEPVGSGKRVWARV
ncbi:MAG: ATP-binding protein [Mycobacteriales bacterium]